MGKRFYFEKEETKITKQRGWFEMDTEFTQVFDSFPEILRTGKSVAACKLLFWLLANEANKSNGFSSSIAIFNKFNKYLQKEYEITYRTFINCIHELVDIKAITKVGKGQYYFNPFVMWRSKHEGRVDFIEAETKENKQLSYNPKSKNSG